MKKDIRTLLQERILILDGAMGTMIQKHKLTEKDYRGELFADAKNEMKGNNDLLSLTQPQIILDIHKQYLEAGSDIIETNTFSSTTVSMADYGMQKYVEQLNTASVKLARQAADEYTQKNPQKPRFVAGSIGPTNKSCSISPDVNNPAVRAISFDELKVAYTEQIQTLIAAGVDLLLIETCFDTLNAKAALFAAEQVIKESGKDVPIMLSITLSGKSGRTLAGQTLEALLASVEHINLLSIGLNCSFGASDMKPFLAELSRIAPYYISAYPNAGLPNSLGQYDETPEKMAVQIKEYLDEGLVNIIGGCCGTTPDHIAQYERMIHNAPLRTPPPPSNTLILSGLETLNITPETNFVNIGERCNVAGSRKFLRLIKEQNYEEASHIALKQVEDGAQVLDINMDEGLLDAEKEIKTFIQLISSDPDIARIPVMIDSSKWEVIETGLKCLQGKSIVNSISLKNGEEDFIEKASLIKSYGAAVVIMAFDETGQADTFERKIEICQRAYNLLTQKVGFKPYNIIFDPNILAIATGMDTDANYGLDFIRATEWIKQNLPYAKVSGGVSNLSFSFRGNDYLRESIHAVFLYHTIKKGMDMGIVNPSSAVLYEDISPELLKVVEDAVLNKHPQAMENLIEYAQQSRDEAGGSTQKDEKQLTWRTLPLEERLEYALIKGISEFMEEDLAEALKKYPNPINIIDEVLMNGMNKVGDLFGSGKMFLPQVVKTARTMKKAVAILQPAIEAMQTGTENSRKKGKQILATVKGDVHDIGKNIVNVVMSCNNYEIIDMGVMVPTADIIKMAIQEKVDIVGLSGLITPSLDEMCHVAEEMEKAGLKIPLIIGGATTSKIHTALKVAPKYSGPVIHLKDASLNPVAASKLLNSETRQAYINEVLHEQEELCKSFQEHNIKLISLEEATKNKPEIDWTNYIAHEPKTPVGKVETIAMPLKEIVPFINWKMFFAAWQVGGKYENIEEVINNPKLEDAFILSQPVEKRDKAIEALKLFKDALTITKQLAENPNCTIEACFGFFKTYSETQKLIIEDANNQPIELPVLRQQIQKPEANAHYLALSDFIAPKESGKMDYIGGFIVTIGEFLRNEIEKTQKENDQYKLLLLQSLTDRMVEAGTEYFHYLVRTQLWGFAPNEENNVSEILKGHYRSIRPAVGYPSLPDQSSNFVLDKLLNMKRINVQITENGAMSPSATVSGLLIAHPLSQYFAIGKIGKDQLSEYSKAKGNSVEDTNKWLIGNI